MVDPVAQRPAEQSVARDFYELRREGIGRIEETASELWTDYNVHDPGISTLEALAYAITELAHRSGFAIEDIIASTDGGGSSDEPYPNQAFPTARAILTVNPTTVADVRRVLIDLDRVRNAWVSCDSCPCDAGYFAWCEDGELVLGYDPALRPETSTEFVRVDPGGLYRIHLQLEADPSLGDLNDRRIVRLQTVVDPEGRNHVVIVELRFPSLGPGRRDDHLALLGDAALTSVVVAGPNRTTTGTTPVDDAELRRYWNEVFYFDYTLDLADGTRITIENASARLFGDSVAREQAVVDDLLGWVADATPEGFVEFYRQKLRAADRAIEAAKATLSAHRNLDEDFCRVDLVDIEDIGVCADVQVEPDADIELVQATIWFRIESHLDPGVDFSSAEELLALGVPADAIFNGPELNSGFPTGAGLYANELEAELRVSDLLNDLVDIPGVVSVENLLLTGYDTMGRAITGTADPDWDDATQQPDPTKTSAAWILQLRAGHRPRLHRGLSSFHFSSRGLPFRPRIDEAEDTLAQLRGEAARPKLRPTDLDLAAPPGRRRDLESYQPVQHGFPLTYGIGPAGLPSNATAVRRAQSQQFKGYLMVFEQLLRNAYAQVAHAGDLFSLDPDTDHTYFSAEPSDVTGYADLVDPAVVASLPAMVETRGEFVDRRNRFLDHLLSRFGETFREYATLLTDLEGKGKAAESLIREKLAYVRLLPRLGHDRGRAFDRLALVCDPENNAGLKERVHLLLGLPGWQFTYRAAFVDAPPGYTHAFGLDDLGEPIATFEPPVDVESALTAVLAEQPFDPTAEEWEIRSTADGREISISAAGASRTEPVVGPDASDAARSLGRTLARARSDVVGALTSPDRYALSQTQGTWSVDVVDSDAVKVGSAARTFDTRAAALAFVSQATTWAAHRRAIVVEHLLLRPKFPGDALYPACTDGPACLCGDEDPYSFRLSYVIPGWTAPFSTNITVRRYAERTIQEQTPSHLVVKTCWVGNDGYLPNPCEPLVEDIAEALEPGAPSYEDACTCAREIYDAYGEVFTRWFDDHPLDQLPAQVLAESLGRWFEGEVDLATVACSGIITAAVRTSLDDLLVPHFVDIAVRGFQFERFEAAWCAWAEADAAIDWTDERLHETVLDLLRAEVDDTISHQDLCSCASSILAAVGTSFRDWLSASIEGGVPLDRLGTFDPPALPQCRGVSVTAQTAEAIRGLLSERYVSYTEVSYRLSVLVRVLAGLRSTYPHATLHDCDEGSDFNPVQLGQTALGSN